MTISPESLLAEFDAAADALRAEAGESETREGVRRELGRLVLLDQLCRKYGSAAEGLSEEEWKAYRGELSRRWRAIGEASRASLRVIVDRHGWPVISRFGRDGADAAWLIVQHSDEDPELQKAILAVLEALLSHGEVEPAHYACLFDRVALNEGRPQRFGTQADGPLEAPERVGQLRAAVGLPPIEARP